MITNCFRYLGINDVDKVYMMTPNEYITLMKAHSLRDLDRKYEAHMQAWLSRTVNATEKKGKKETYKFAKFEDFFDYEKEQKRIEKAYKRKPIDQEKVDKFKASVKRAEALLNGRG